MTVVGLHPEELFDKLLDGELSSGERERLRQHLDSCEVCRFEYAARLDFQSEALDLASATPPVALPLRVPQPLPEEHPAPVAVAPARRRRSRRLIWGLAAAALITASGAVASGLTGAAPWHTLGALFLPTKAAPPAPVTPPRLAPLPARAGTSSAAGAEPAEVVAAEPVVADALPKPAVVVQPQRVPAVRAQGAPVQVAVAAVPAAVAPPEVTAKDPPKEAPKEPSSAAKLFGEANQARRSGDVGRASGLYHLLQEQFPGSPEADLSRVTMALLLLDGGDAQGALAGFERYLAGSSRGLEAEALVGRARALGRLGRRDLEAAAWREVQRKYPRSIYGRQASERLAALGQP